MKKSLLVGLCVGGALATAGGAIALRDASPSVATILAVTPITAGMEQQYAEVLSVSAYRDPAAPVLAEVVSSRPITVQGGEQEVCEDVVVKAPAQAQDKHQIAGTAAGAVIGGVLGNQVGGGNGKKIATAAGAIVGGLVGKNVQTHQQNKQVRETVERQCRWEQGPDRTTGYDVTYRLDGGMQTLRLDYDPGRQLPVVNGRLVTDASEARKLLERRMPEQYEVNYRIGDSAGTMVLPRAPAVGELMLAQDGQVVTDAATQAAIQARQHQVVAYRVSYQLGREQGEVRMTDKPMGTQLPARDGRVVATGVSEG